MTTKEITRRYGRRINDATKDLVIRVKPEDIKGAICRDHQKCVFARAIMRQKKSTVKWVDVGNHVVLIGTGKTTGQRYVLNDQSKKQLRFFDTNDGRFAPCVAKLIAPVVRKLGDRIGEPYTRKKRKKRGKNIQTPTR